MDELRIVKSDREIALVRRASQLAGLGLMEAMRSTQAGAYEYQLDAAARYVFQVNGARREGYASITAGGANAWMGHYFHNDAVLKDGDLVLMDYAPDFRYYTSDVARMWPVSGTFTQGQRELCEFILAYRNTLLKHIRPGVTANQVMDESADEMRAYFESATFSKPEYAEAARKALAFRGHLSHPVGMTVHDVGNYKVDLLKPGMVFSIDPMLWVPEEKLYVRMEDVVAVTDSGVENFSDFVPSRLEDIERLMREEGVVQLKPSTEAWE
jgi:Xaa-Pro aminopeptidase